METPNWREMKVLEELSGDGFAEPLYKVARVGQVTLDGMVKKGWIHLVYDEPSHDVAMRITPAGQKAYDETV